MNNTPFFIIGSKRGGTTLLRMMLNSHPEIAIPPESHFLIPILEKFPPDIKPDANQKDEIIQDILNAGRFETWSTTPLEVREFIEGLPPGTSLREIVDGIFKLEISKQGKSRWGEKTPEYVDIVDQLAGLFHHAKFLFLIRDGRDVINSLKTKGWEGWSIYQRGKYWSHCVQTIFNFSTKHQNSHLVIHYEELVLQTEQTLRKICQFLAIPFRREMLEYYKTADQHITQTEKNANIHNKLSRLPSLTDLYKWKRTDNPGTIFLAEASMQKELQMAGYDFDQYRPNNPFHYLKAQVYSAYGTLSTFAYIFYHHYLPSGWKDLLKKIKLGKNLRKAVRSS